MDPCKGISANECGKMKANDDGSVTQKIKKNPATQPTYKRTKVTQSSTMDGKYEKAKSRTQNKQCDKLVGTQATRKATYTTQN